MPARQADITPEAVASYGRRSIRIVLTTLVCLIAPSPFVAPARGQSTNGNGNGNGTSSGFDFSGDFRVRYEDTTKQKPNGVPGRLDPRHRGVVRFRAGVAKKVGDMLKVNFRIATGARGDPNTTDVTLGDFVDDLEISLERASLEFDYKGVFVTGGKFANPFVKGQLVWDEDVHPGGVTWGYTFSGSKRVVSKLIGMYSIVDEATVNPDSYMWGGQAQVLVRPAARWTITLAGGYYDYTIKSLTHADAGDTLSNNLTADKTRFLSDFNLADAVLVIEHPFRDERFPLRFIGNYTKNLGARVPEDNGYAFDLFIGRASAKNDKRYRYGYSRAAADAVLGAFSHDDTTFSTNYRQHSMTFDYVPTTNLLLNATWYLYRRDHGPGTDNLISRLRLNATVSF